MPGHGHPGDLWASALVEPLHIGCRLGALPTPAAMTSNLEFHQLHHGNAAAVRDELAAGLRAAAAQIAPKHFYDALGARLFEAITALPEYYPTRAEALLFEQHSADLAAHAPAGATLIDLGAGNCAKAAGLFGALRPAHYVAVDISVEFLRTSLERLSAQHPQIRMTGVGIDFAEGLHWPAEVVLRPDAPRVLFYPGSSIGNFTPTQALHYLQSLHATCAGVSGSGLLIGVDLVKDRTTLETAYDDPLGVTAAFNRNMLRHVNRQLGSDFAIEDWRHLAYFDAAQSRIEMHLEALRPVTVRWPGGQRSFAAGERIHTENSYKWTVTAFEALLREAGFGAQTGRITHWVNTAQPFALFWAGL